MYIRYIACMLVYSGWFWTTHALQYPSATHGYGQLGSIQNGTGLPCTISYFVDQKNAPLQARLVDQSWVYLMYATPAASPDTTGTSTTPMFCDTTGPFPVLRPADSSKNEDATFLVMRYTGPYLDEWFTLYAPPINDPNTNAVIRKGGCMRVDESTGKVFFDGDPSVFASKDGSSMQWQLFGNFDACIITNKATGGSLLPQTGTTDVPIPGQSSSQKFSIAWGVNSSQQLCIWNDITKAWTSSQTTAKQIAILDSRHAWRIDMDGKLYEWDGTTWTDISFVPDPVDWLYCDGSSNIWCVVQGVLYQLQNDQWQPQCTKADDDTSTDPWPIWKACAVDNQNNIWLLDNQQKIYLSAQGNKPTVITSPIPSYKPTKLALAYRTVTSGSSQTKYPYIFALDDQGQAWQFAPLPGQETTSRWSVLPVTLQSIGGTQVEQLWGVGTDGTTMSFDGTNWRAAAVQPPTKLNNIAAASGVENITGGQKTTQQNTTWLSAGFPTKQDAGNATFGIKMLQEGPGAQFTDKASMRYNKILSGAWTKEDAKKYAADKNPEVQILTRYVTVTDFSDDPVPITKKPVVMGFSQDQIANMAPGTLVTLSRMFGQGVAWFSASLQEQMGSPNQCSLSFYASTGSTGGLHIVFGNQRNSKWIWRIIIGADNNTATQIFKRTDLPNGTEKQELMCSVLAKDNPAAATQPGVLTPYWVSIDNGLIIVGKGDVGSNIILSWRDPSAPTDINYLGLGTDQQPISFAQCALSLPVTLGQSARIYTQTTAPITLTNQPSWLPTTFRLPDYASVGMRLQGPGPIQVRIAAKATADTPCYMLTFGQPTDKGPALVCQRVDKNGTKTLGSILHANLPPELTPDATIPRDIWISYVGQQMFVGTGSITSSADDTQNAFLAATFRDAKPLTQLTSVGVASSAQTGQVLTAQAAAPIKLKPAIAQSVPIRDLYLIMPFAYRFSQEETSVKAVDVITGQAFYSANTPQPGTFYTFALMLDAKGIPNLQWSRLPSNPFLTNVSRRFVELGTDQSQTITSAMKDQDARNKALAQKKIALDAAQQALDAMRKQIDPLGTALKLAGQTLAPLATGVLTVTGMGGQGIAEHLFPDQVVKDEKTGELRAPTDQELLAKQLLDLKDATKPNLLGKVDPNKQKALDDFFQAHPEAKNFSDTMLAQAKNVRPLKQEERAKYVTSKSFAAKLNEPSFQEKLRATANDPKYKSQYDQIKKQILGFPSLDIKGKKIPSIAHGRAWWMAAITAGSMSLSAGLMVGAAIQDLEKQQDLGKKAEDIAKQKAEIAQLQAQDFQDQLKIQQKLQAQQAEVDQLLFDYNTLQQQAADVASGTNKKQDIATARIPPSATENRSQAQKLLQSLSMQPTNAYAQRMNILADVLRLSTHPYVLGDRTLQNQLLDQLAPKNSTGACALLLGQGIDHALKQQLLDLLASAYTNEYLDQGDMGNIATTRSDWLDAMSTLAQQMLADPAHKSVRIPPLNGNFLWLEPTLDQTGGPQTLDASGKGALSFQVQEALCDLLVAFSQEKVARLPGRSELYLASQTQDGSTRLFATNSELYEFGIGVDNNTKTVLIIPPSTVPARLATKKTYPTLMLSNLSSEAYWINLTNGVLSMGKGAIGTNRLLSWKDPYPISGIKYIGLGSGRKSIKVVNVTVNDTLQSSTAAKTK